MTIEDYLPSSKILQEAVTISEARAVARQAETARTNAQWFNTQARFVSGPVSGDELARAKANAAHAEFEAPEADPAEADPEEAEPTELFYSKIKRDGIWSHARFEGSLSKAIDTAADEPWAAVVVEVRPTPAGFTDTIVWSNRRAANAGMHVGRIIASSEAEAPSSDTCPIHGADCEAWA